MAATAPCPKCGHTNQLPACGNCDGITFRIGPLADGSEGWICQNCNLGYAYIYCQNNCGAMIPAEAFLSGWAKNKRAADRGECFIATELYGGDSIEVAILRRFRDHVLVKTYLGTSFVSAYYRISPKIIPIMRRSTLVRFFFRTWVALSVFIVRALNRRSGPPQAH